MKIVSFELFLETLHKRLGEKYDIKVLKKVLESYLSSRIGLTSMFDKRIEFTDQYFGTFRFSEKGYEEFCDKIKELMRLREIHIDMEHDSARRKIIQEKAKDPSWKAKNLINGHKYINKEQEAFRRKKAEIKSEQSRYLRLKQSKQLKIDRKIRNL